MVVTDTKMVNYLTSTIWQWPFLAGRSRAFIEVFPRGRRFDLRYLGEFDTSAGVLSRLRRYSGAFHQD